MKVDNKHEKYISNLPKWEKVRTAVKGQEAVKSASENYLPKLNGQDDNSYEAYLKRAQYANYSGKTLDISLGQLFRKSPVGTDDIDDNIIANIDLAGTTFDYFSRELASELFETNWSGVLVDFSEELKRPYLALYKAEDIINWKYGNANGKTILNLVVLQGKVEKIINDPFEAKFEDVWRVLYLTQDGVYAINEYIRGDDVGKKESGDDFILRTSVVPVRDGNPLGYIPFYFVSCNGNIKGPGKPVLLDFVNVNLGHYVNSADYENMLHWTGAKTAVTIGLGKDKNLPVGGAIDLPVGGNAFFMEAASDSGLKEEMRHKEEQMAVMGASLISGSGRYVASAKTAEITSQGEYATLADVSNSLSSVMSKIMTELTMWTGDSGFIAIEYNKDFELAKIDPMELTQFMGAVQAGYMSWETFFYNMQNRELYPDGWTIEDERKAIEKNQVEVSPEEIDIND